jgi:MoxR-like ATPase
LLEIQNLVKTIHVEDAVSDYAVELVRRTREHRQLLLGASPRATLALLSASKAYAFLQRRDFVIPDDIKWLAPYVLGHRLVLETEARLEGVTLPSIFEGIFRDAKVPVRLER